MRRLYAVVFLLLVIPRLHAAEPQWVEVKSQNFTVMTDAGEKTAKDVALRFEQMRALFASLFKKTTVNTSVPLQIIAFRGSKQMRPYLNLFNGKPVENAGFYQSGTDRSFIVLDMSAEERWRTVFHEYAHLLLDANIPDTQLWFDEGFAEYFSTIEINGQEFRIGVPPPNVGYTLSNYKWMPCAQLFSIQHESKEYNVGDPRHIFYAESWLMMHYLFDGKKLNEASNMMTFVHDGATIPDAIQKAFGIQAAELDKELRRYYDRNKAIFYKGPLPPGANDLKYAGRPMPALEAQANLADLHAHSLDYRDKAIEEFEQIVRLDPENGIAHRGLGYAYLQKQDFVGAADHFRIAATKLPGDPRVHYYWALMMQLQSRLSSSMPDKLDEIRRELKTALELDPNFTDAHALMGWVCSLSRDYDGAVRSLQKAIQLSPRNEIYVLNLAHVYMMDGKLEKATPLFERLKASKEPMVAADADRSLKTIQTMNEMRAQGIEIRDQTRKITAPQWDPDKQPKQTETEFKEPEPEKPPVITPIKYLTGTLVSIDCSSDPVAVLTVVSGKNTWTMRTKDRNKLLLIGVDKFSCDWKKRAVLVNYRATGANEADVVTLELK